MKKSIIIASLLLMAQTAISQTFTSYTTIDGLINDNVLDVSVASNGNVWFGTQLGVSEYDGTTWTSYNQAGYPGMADDNILSIFVDNAGDTWIGTDYGTSVFNGTAWTTYTTTDGLDNNKVQCINEDGLGNMWFGTINGLSKFDGTNWTTFGTADGLPFGGVNSITIATNNEVYLGTGLSGVAIYNGTSFSTITENDGLISNKIRAVAFAPNGKRWVGTTDGITVLDNSNSYLTNHTAIYTLPAPDTLNPVEDVKIDGNGVVWAGIYVDYLVTEGGVCAYNGSQWFEFDVSDGIAGPVIRALDIAANNEVWVATSTGVTKIGEHSLGIQTQDVLTLNIFPNPSSDKLTIELTETNTNLEIEIYSIALKKLMSIEVFSGQSTVEVDISDLKVGMYIIKVGDISQKIIKI
jgi:ligand-binding sensor domain-containing protein